MLTEGRFQWSIQKSIKIKAIPFLVGRLYELGDSTELDDLEQEFETEYQSVSVATTAKKQRPFWRTINFIRDDLGLLGDDNKLRLNVIPTANESDVREAIYNHADEKLIPFNLLLKAFKDLGIGLRNWADVRRILSSRMVERARAEFPNAYAKKDESSDWGVDFWEMDDPSLNRLVELFRLLGMCSFVVLKHVRYLGSFEKSNNLRTIDFEDIIGLLKTNVPDFGAQRMMTVDMMFNVVSKRGVMFEVMEDAILSNSTKVQLFSGKENEERHITHNHKEYYRLRFNEKALGE